MFDETMELPLDVATAETARFVAATLAPGASVIEVGCGDGELAAVLQTLGFAVVGLDADAACVERARARGVRAVNARWPDFAAAQADALAFTRSLHHIDPLEDALVAARRMLRPEGLLLLDEFAFELADAAAVRWLRTMVDVLVADSALNLDSAGPALIPILRASDDPVTAWRRYHEEHRVHRGDSLRRSVDKVFGAHKLSRVPYLYRCLIPRLTRDPAGAAAARHALEREEGAIAEGAIPPLGLRVIACRAASDPRLAHPM
jgi:SAM-dependent methyltransferase